MNKVLTKSIESSLCDYSGAYILVTGNIAVTGTIAAAGNNPIQRNQLLITAMQVAFQNCGTEINDTFVDETDFINIAMLCTIWLNITEDNYSDTSKSLWGFKKDGITGNADVTNYNDTPSFKYIGNLITDTEANGKNNRVKITVPLKYFRNFWRSLEMPLINCKVEPSLEWIENCVLTTAAIGAYANATGADSATFKITDTKLYIPVVTLSTEGSKKLEKQIPVYWKKYKVIHNANDEKYIRELLDSSYQGVKRFFVLAYDNTTGNNQVSVDSFKLYSFLEQKLQHWNWWKKWSTN